MPKSIPQKRYFISTHNPDFIIGSESWLTDSVSNSEVFPPDYSVFRRDRPGGRGGGVFLASKNTIACKHIELDTDCEVVACEIELPNHSPLIIAALYRPPYNDTEYMENLCDSLNRIITKYNNPTVWLAGDLNLPNIDWSNNTVNGNHYPLSLCNVFLNFMAYHGLVQMNFLPTRYNNILDVFLTNQPLTSISVEIAPGISDHEAVIVSGGFREARGL